MIKFHDFLGRAAILIKLLGLDKDIIESVYKKSQSMQVGYDLPGTKIPILSDDKLFSKIQECKIILNLSGHIPNEISSYLKASGDTGKNLSIIES